jgi:hypothetical protein
MGAMDKLRPLFPAMTVFLSLNEKGLAFDVACFDFTVDTPTVTLSIDHLRDRFRHFESWKEDLILIFAGGEV